uniref:Uncharacterized protein n=1 Tax=Arundo donax TaxID=35708 RepID=A0A0A9K4B9_ARUDO
MSTRHNEMRLTSMEPLVNSTNLLWHPAVSFSAPRSPFSVLLRFLRGLITAAAFADAFGTRLLEPMQEMLSFDALLSSSSDASAVLFSLWKMVIISLIRSSESLFGLFRQIFLSGGVRLSDEWQWLLLRMLSDSSPLAEADPTEALL